MTLHRTALIALILPPASQRSSTCSSLTRWLPIALKWSWGKTISRLSLLDAPWSPWCLCGTHSMFSPGAWNEAELGLGSEHHSSCCRGLRSVYRQFAGDLLSCFGSDISLLEVLVARSAAQPGLPEVDPAGEEKAAGTWFNATLQQSPNFALAGHPTVTGEQGVLLAKHSGGADFDHGRSKVLIFHHWSDVSSYHCG